MNRIKLRTFWFSAPAKLQAAFTSAAEIWLAEAKFKLAASRELTSQPQPYNSSKASL